MRRPLLASAALATALLPGTAGAVPLPTSAALGVNDGVASGTVTVWESYDDVTDPGAVHREQTCSYQVARVGVGVVLTLTATDVASAAPATAQVDCWVEHARENVVHRVTGASDGPVLALTAPSGVVADRAPYTICVRSVAYPGRDDIPLSMVACQQPNVVPTP